MFVLYSSFLFQYSKVPKSLGFYNLKYTMLHINCVVYLKRLLECVTIEIQPGEQVGKRMGEGS